jgi:hypothetical protein
MGFTDFVSDAGLTRTSLRQLPPLPCTDLYSPRQLVEDTKLHFWVCDCRMSLPAPVRAPLPSLVFYDENNLVRVDEVD